MRLKRFTAPTMADALRFLKTEMGPEAQIVSTRKVTGLNGKPTLEITAALDDDPLPAASARPALPRAMPQPLETTNKEHDPLEGLALHGVAETLAGTLKQAVEALEKAGFTEADGLEMVLGKQIGFIPPGEAIAAGYTHILVGPVGSGKTTTLAKLAAGHVMQGERVGLISLDDKKIGGWEQFRIFADILQTTPHMVKNGHPLSTALRACEGTHATFIDTPGFSPAETDRMAELAERLKSMAKCKVHLVLPAHLHSLQMVGIARAFAPLNPESLIFTHLDLTAYWGGMVNTAHQTGLPLSFVTDGPAVPHDLARIDAASLARKLLSAPQHPWENAS